jgi:hypothetical protein
MNYLIWHRRILEWAVLITTALIAMRQFYVQELIAAFVIFSVLFACLATVVAGGALMIFFVDRAGQIAGTWSGKASASLANHQPEVNKLHVVAEKLMRPKFTEEM